MGVEVIGARTNESLGVEKSNARPITNRTKQLTAEEYNRIADAVIELQQAVGTTVSPAAGSLEARVVDALADATAALADAATALATATAADETATAAQADATQALADAATAQSAADNHDARHVAGGADEIDGDLIDIDFDADGVYTPTIEAGVTTQTNHLTSHLKGIAARIAALVTGVSSVFGRAGAVTATAGDYTSTQITNSSTVSGTWVTDALNNLLGFIQGVFAVDSGGTLGDASRTFVLTDAGKVLVFSRGSGQTLTVPTNASVAFPVGTIITCIQAGSGQLTVQPFDGTVTVRATDALKSREQYALITLLKIGTNEWYLTGETATS